MRVFNYRDSRNAKYNIQAMLISQTRGNLWTKSKGKLYSLDMRRSSNRSDNPIRGQKK